MSRSDDLLNEPGESFPPVLAPTLKVINQLVNEGLISDYVIGGSMAILVYSEPFYTKDLDLFVHLPQRSFLLDLGPIWRRLQELGYKPAGIAVIIKGVPVEFLATDSPLIEEAFATATTVEIEGVTTKVFQLEYALAIKIQTGRAKDWNHIEIALNSAEPDITKLEGILQKFDLIEKWRRYRDR
jgi:predicted nucleotidyltransferase